MKRDRSAKKSVGALTHERCPSGIEGLDDILDGGLPRECFYLIQGDPGSGKTTLALQFLLEGLRRGESVFYITLSETRQELLTVVESHGWSLEGIEVLELSAIEQLVRPEAHTTVFHPSEVELNKVSKLLIDETTKNTPCPHSVRFAFGISVDVGDSASLSTRVAEPEAPLCLAKKHGVGVGRQNGQGWDRH